MKNMKITTTIWHIYLEIGREVRSTIITITKKITNVTAMAKGTNIVTLDIIMAKTTNANADTIRKKITNAVDIIMRKIMNAIAMKKIITTIMKVIMNVIATAKGTNINIRNTIVPTIINMTRLMDTITTMMI